MAGYPLLYKPSGSPTSAGAGRPVVATAGGGDVLGVSILDQQGNVIQSGKRDTFPHVPEPGETPGPFGQNWNFGGSAASIPAGSLIRVQHKDGTYSYASIKNPLQGFRGSIDSGEGTLDNPAVLPSSGSSGVPQGFAPGNIGFGSVPAFLGGLFPSASLANFPTIQTAPFKYTDPFAFGSKFADFSRQQIAQNADLANQLSLKQLGTELQGLQTFEPAAAALQRSQTSADNQFNQAQRTAQVNQVLPNAQNDLNAQRQRAATYAQGQVPDSVINNALNLSVGSQGADQSRAAGFGADSRAGQRITDLLSAQQRIQLSQYGDQLLSSNTNQQAGLFLAPTEYANAGSQIRVTPTLSGAQLSQANLGAINSLSQLSAGQAIQSEIGQQQFSTSLEEQNRQFNSQGQFASSEFNATAKNNFALDKFGYLAGFANAASNAGQINTNTGLALQQQAQAAQIAAQTQASAQNVAALGGLGQLGGLASGVAAGVGSILNGPSQGSPSSSGGASTPAPTANAGVSNPVQVGGVSYPSGPSLGGPAGSIVIPSGSTVPPGYTGVQSAPNGGTIAIPSESSSNPGFGVPGNGSAPSPPPQGPAAGVDEGSISSGGGFDSSGDTGVGPESFTPRNGNISKFVSALGASTPSPENQSLMESHSAAMLHNAGITPNALPSTTPIGVDNSGQPLYANKALLNSNNANAGSSTIVGLKNVLSPLGVTANKEDSAKLDNISKVASDSKVLNDLTSSQQNNDIKGFLNTLSSAYGVKLDASNGNKNSLSGAFGAYNMAQNWNSMSPAQRSLAVASLGLQTTRFNGNLPLSAKPIITPTNTAPGLNVGQALNLLKSNTNVYSLAKNWNQVAAVQTIAGGQPTTTKMAQTATQLNLLGHGIDGSAVPITEEDLNAKGWKASPAEGIGAIRTDAANNQVPNGYTAINSNVAVPTANLKSAAVATSVPTPYKNWLPPSTQSSTLNGVNGGSQMSASLSKMADENPYLFSSIAAHNIAQNAVKTVSTPKQGTNVSGTIRPIAEGAGAANTVAGAAGHGVSGAGTAISVATTGAQVFDTLNNPNLTPKDRGTLAQQQVGAAVASAYTFGLAAPAISFARGQYPGTLSKLNSLDQKINPVTIGLAASISGKSGDQSARDGMRSLAQRAGLADSDFQVTLANGSKADIGVDGHGGYHSVTNSSLLSPEQQGKVSHLNSWDTDYTNDLDYAAGMGGTTLSRLLAGSTGKAQDQFGGQLGNAALSNIGYGKEFSEGNYNSAMGNLRSMFSQAGIKSKSDAYNLINQGFAEHRFTDTDVATMHQAVNMVFDGNSYGAAQKLLSGRNRGVEVALSQRTIPSSPQQNFPVERPQAAGGQVPFSQSSQVPTGSTSQPLQNSPKPSFNPAKVQTQTTDVNALEGLRAKSSLLMSKDEVRANNLKKFNQTPQSLNAA